jgi:hypothetical protein
MIVDDDNMLSEEFQKFCQPWRSMIIAIDGINGSGKSTLARFLAWKLNMTAIDTDLFLITGTGKYDLRLDDFKRAINTRFSRNRPSIVEGVFLRRTLKDIECQDIINIYVRKLPADSNLDYLPGLAQYLSEYDPENAAEHIYEWKDCALAS